MCVCIIHTYLFFIKNKTEVNNSQGDCKRCAAPENWHHFRSLPCLNMKHFYRVVLGKKRSAICIIPILSINVSL